MGSLGQPCSQKRSWLFCACVWMNSQATLFYRGQSALERSFRDFSEFAIFLSVNGPSTRDRAFFFFLLPIFFVVFFFFLFDLSSSLFSLLLRRSLSSLSFFFLPLYAFSCHVSENYSLSRRALKGRARFFLSSFQINF